MPLSNPSLLDKTPNPNSFHTIIIYPTAYSPLEVLSLFGQLTLTQLLTSTLEVGFCFANKSLFTIHGFL
jgi:hypothetical protein